MDASTEQAQRTTAPAREFMRGITVRKRAGRWFVFVNHNGKRRAKAFHGKEKAKAFARKTEKALKSAEWNLAFVDWSLPGAETPGASPALTFGAYADAYLAAKQPNGRGEGPLKFSTWRDYSKTVALHLAPILGEKPLGALARDDVKRLPAALRQKGRSQFVIKKTVRVLSAILSEAVEAGELTTNPALGIKWKGELRTPQRSIIPLTPDELRQVLQTARDYQVTRGGQIVHPFRQHYVFLLLAAHTGLRLGELLGLRFGDVDWNAKLLHVQRARVLGKLTSPKSHQLRIVELNDVVFGALQSLRDERFPRTVAALDPEEQARLNAERAEAMLTAALFVNGEGRPIDPAHWRHRTWYPLLMKAGVRHVRFHDLRHGFATLLLDHGESPYYVQAMLGHHDAAFTMRVYGHRMPKDHRGVDRLVDLVPPVADQLQNPAPNRPVLSTSDHEKPNKAVGARG